MSMDARSENFQARIRAERKRQGVTQLELSQAADVGRRFVVELENGKETVQVGKMLKVLDILGIDFQLLDAKVF